MPQPGLRISIISGMLDTLAKNGRVRAMFSRQDEAVKFFDEAIESIYGHMLEEIVMCDVDDAVSGFGLEVFKAIFDDCEYDLVVRDAATNECGIYEIKHSMKIDFQNQAKNIVDAETAALLENAGNHIVSRRPVPRR